MALSLSKKVHTEDIEQETCYMTESRTAHWNFKLVLKKVEQWKSFFVNFQKPDKLRLDTAGGNVAK